MSGASSIEWTDATWNPVRGCSRVSEGCRNCYAERQAARFGKSGLPFHGFAQVTAPRDDLDRVGRRRNGWTGKVGLVPSALDWPLRWRGDKQARAEGRPSRIFVNSMSDLFHERLSDEDIAAVFGVMAACPQHVFQVLTKRPERARKWFEWLADWANQGGMAEACTGHANEQLGLWGEPNQIGAHGTPWPLSNIWLGVSVEDQVTADERIPLLLQTPAAVRFVSYEPAIGAVDFSQWLGGSDATRGCRPNGGQGGRVGDRLGGSGVADRRAASRPMAGRNPTDPVPSSSRRECDRDRVSPSSGDVAREEVSRARASSCVPSLQGADSSRSDDQPREREQGRQPTRESDAGGPLGTGSPCDQGAGLEAGEELSSLSWLIVGGESGPGARPFDLEWARSAVKQCKAAGVACFYKQGGTSNACEHDRKGGHFDCFPSHLKIREFPVHAATGRF